MIVEINGVGFRNMGAELMLVAAREELLSWRAIEAVGIGFRLGTREQRRGVACVGVLRVNSDTRSWANHAFSLGSRLVPSSLLQATGMVKPTSIGALIDASGFAFGDQWGVLPSRRNGRVYAEYARRDTPIVLLPQAFGPFHVPEVAHAAREALDHAGLVFARDKESMVHLRGLELTKPRLLSAPDFTNLLEPPVRTASRPTVVVIPNARMTDMGGPVAESEYLEFLSACIATSLVCGYQVILIGHEEADQRFAATLAADFDPSVSTFYTKDPLETKAMIGGSSLVISSRYHGLVNALSQAVPAIGTGWSHKYAHLFADYGCPDALWGVATSGPTHARLTRWLRPAELARRSAALKAPASALKEASRRMWSEVSSYLLDP